MTVKPAQSNTLGVILAFTILYVVWGSTYLAIYFALESLPPFMLAAIRFVIAGVIMIAWCLINKQNVPPIHDIIKISLAGVLLLTFGIGGVIWAEQYLPSGIAAIMPATIPLWLIVFDTRNWKKNLSNTRLILGLFIGFVGVSLLVYAKPSLSNVESDKVILGFAALACGAISWSVGTLYTKYAVVKATTEMKTGIQMFMAGMVCLLLALVVGEPALMQSTAITVKSVWSMIYLIVFGSLVAYLSYMWLITVKPVPLVSTYVYVNPAVALFLGWLFANETVGMLQLVSVMTILFGVLIVNFSKQTT